MTHHTSPPFAPTVTLLALLLLSGCSALPSHTGEPQPLQGKIPGAWATATSNLAIAEPPQPWLRHFSNPRLRELVTEALRNNTAIERAVLRWQRLRSQLQIDGTLTRPTTTTSLTASRKQSSGAPTPLRSGALGVTLSTTWEVDLWNRLSDRERVTALQERATAAELDAARLSLVAAVTRQWFVAIAGKQQVALSQERLENYRKAEKIIADRYRNGLSSALDLQLSRSEVALAEEQQIRQRQQHQERIQALELLLGRYPANQLEVSGTLPRLSETIPAGIPSSLLERRPDIIASQRRLAAAGLEASIATRNRLPTFSLTASGGSSSGDLRHLLDWNHLVWSLIGGLTQPLFQQQRLEAEQLLKKIDHEETLSHHIDTMLNSFHEVEHRLAADQLLRQRRTALQQAADAARHAAGLALSSYQGGLVDVLTLLDAQRRSYDRQSALIQAQVEQIENRIDLHLALGGDY